jgi:hypothetical protein
LLRAGQLESVETIEIEPMVVEAAALFKPRNADVFTDPRSRIVIDDARAHLARSKGAYDLIVSEPSNPWVSGVAGLFTREFYGQVARKLAGNGHFVQWLHLYEASPELVASILKAFSAEFPEYKVYAANEADVVLVARADGGKVELSPDALSSAGLRQEFAQIGVADRNHLEAHELSRSGVMQVLAHSYPAPPNSDFYPYVDGRAARDRFIGATATTAFDMHLAPVPFLEFGRPAPPYLGAINDADPSMPRKVGDLAGARQGARLLRGERLNNAQRAHLGLYAQQYELVRGWLWGCQPISDRTLWDAAVTVAGEITTGLSPRETADLWDGVLAGPCASRVGQESRQWVELFKAVGQRDPGLVRERADRLLAIASATPRQREYLVLAAAGSRLALGQQQDAKNLFNKERAAIPAAHLNLPWFRYMEAVLSVGRIRTAGPQ